MDYLKDLNPEQRKAVENIEGPVLVIAGPGSGKTRVLTYRIAYMMQQGIDPFNILSLTFTNKAAREMKERIETIVGHEARNLYMGTFHSVFARILRSEGPRLGYPSNFTIYDTDDAKSLIKNIVRELALNDQLYKPNIVYNRISSAKNSLITAKEYKEDLNLTTDDEVSGRPKMAELYRIYADRCFKAGAMDFDDLLLKMYELLKKFPDALHKYQHKFRYILIDEFQDTNKAQYTIVKMLGDVHENICAVGDDAQSIYSFRGANIENILNFEKDYPDLKTFKLEQNYRSTKAIVDIANEVIVKNKMQLPKKIWTDNEDGNKVKVIKSMSDNEEGKLVADSIFEEKMRNHYKNEDFAILYRTNAQSRSFEEALRKLNIPYKVYGGVSFYQRKEVKDLIGYLRLIVNPNDEEALRRVINYPTRGIGKTTMEKLVVLANDQNTSLWNIISNLNRYSITGKAKSSIEDFVTMIRSFAAMAAKKDAFDLAMHVAQSTGILKELYNDKSIEGQSRYENVQELLNSIKEFTAAPPQLPLDDESLPGDTSLGTYLQNVTLLTDMDNDSDDVKRVSLMTIHSAKGLEFPVVYVVGLEENLFPSMMSLNDREDLEEERRLFYVAVTRPMKRLFLTYAATRFRFGNLIYCDPSRFIDEIPPTILEFSGNIRKPAPSFSSSGNGDFFSKKLTPRPKPAAIGSTATKEAEHTPSPDFKPDNTDNLQVGMQVEHQRFGFGKVMSLAGEPGNKIVDIFFQNVGTKRIMLKYAKLRIL